MEMVKLIEPKDLGELAVMKSLLEGSGIPYFVQNEHFGSLYGGATCVVMVPESDLERAEILMGRLLQNGPGDGGE
ncbi:MAG: hypothetical protein C4293_08030 [Nitrospiraceae bacterium]